MTTLPARQCAAIELEFGASGRAWIAGFDRLLEHCRQRWDLELLGSPGGGLPVNVIRFARTANGDEVVLKLAHPHPEQRTEVLALRALAGTRCVRLLDHAPELGATLLERVRPGTPLRHAVPAAGRSRLALEVFRMLPRPDSPSRELPNYADWLRHAFASYRLRPHQDAEFSGFIAAAERAFDAVRNSGSDRYLLHGDLHHENLLAGRDGSWIAIDPKGVIGPRAMECGRYLHNFVEDEVAWANLRDAPVDAIAGVMAARIDALAGVVAQTPATLAAASLVDAVLATTWSLNAGDDVRDALQVVRAAARCWHGLAGGRCPGC